MLIQDLQIVLKVAELKSITAAATDMGLRTATASAAVKRVEAALGAELFVRSTRRLRISSAGEKFIPQCQQSMATLESARQSIKEDLDIVDGELRITVSSDLGRNLVIPWLDDFMELHPKVSLKVNISDSQIDFNRDSVDMALRYGSPEDRNVYGFKICDVPVLLCATPEYLNAQGTPSIPADLATHRGLFYQLHGLKHDSWSFSKDGAATTVKMRGNRSSNDGDLVRRWCVAGKGIALKSALDIANDLLAGRVVHVMPQYKSSATELWLVCPSRQSITPAVRRLRDMCTEKSAHVLQQLAVQGIVD